MRRLSIKNALGLSLMLMLLTACVTSPPPRMDAKFGEALDMAIAQQTLHPEASLDTEPVMGIDGLAADAAFDSYRKSFIARPEQAVGGVGFGSAGGVK
jgi:hypothetical protein